MQKQQGVPTRVVLVAVLALVVAGVTFASLLVVRSRMQRQVVNDFTADLTHTIESFQHLETQRQNALQRENALLADLPSLKALMTSNDQRTIADGAVEFWKVGSNGLFALASPHRQVLAVYTRGRSATPQLARDLTSVLEHPEKHYLYSDGRLFGYSVRPLFFGDETTGTLLGYVISGYSIHMALAEELGPYSSAIFLTGSHLIASTLPSAESLGPQLANLMPGRTVAVSLGKNRYLAIAQDLETSNSAPVRMVILRSFNAAEREQREINRLVVIVGVFAVLAGSILMLAMSGLITGPLEVLARSVRAFGTGDSQSLLPTRGTLEVRQLSEAFRSMRSEIQQTNHALLESERLATIGRMASSVSHDLRHYLAAVYANAEFLASSQLSEAERAELLSDIRVAVLGTTELIDSLLIFSRSAQSARRSLEQVSFLVDRAITLVRAHPDAVNVEISIHSMLADTTAVVDPKQMERAIYNLVLNACQAPRSPEAPATVRIEITGSEDQIRISIMDNGLGIPENVRDHMFEPFVSEGKQKGTGLGLTLTQSIAQEHGGAVELISSRPGETLFALTILRSSQENPRVEKQVVTAG